MKLSATKDCLQQGHSNSFLSKYGLLAQFWYTLFILYTPYFEKSWSNKVPKTNKGSWFLKDFEKETAIDQRTSLVIGVGRLRLLINSNRKSFASESVKSNILNTPFYY